MSRDVIDLYCYQSDITDIAKAFYKNKTTKITTKDIPNPVVKSQNDFIIKLKYKFSIVYMYTCITYINKTKVKMKLSSFLPIPDLWSLGWSQCTLRSNFSGVNWSLDMNMNDFKLETVENVINCVSSQKKIFSHYAPADEQLRYELLVFCYSMWPTVRSFSWLLLKCYVYYFIMVKAFIMHTMTTISTFQCIEIQVAMFIRFRIMRACVFKYNTKHQTLQCVLRWRVVILFYIGIKLELHDIHNLSTRCVNLI